MMSFILTFIVAFFTILVLNVLAYSLSKINVNTFRWFLHSGIGALVVSCLYLVL